MYMHAHCLFHNTSMLIFSIHTQHPSHSNARSAFTFGSLQKGVTTSVTETKFV